jgi:hypothetical protein
MSIIYLNQSRNPKYASKFEEVDTTTMWRSFYDGSMDCFVTEVDWASKRLVSQLLTFLSHGIKVVVFDNYLGRTIKLDAPINMPRTVTPTTRNIKALLAREGAFASAQSRLQRAKELLAQKSVSVGLVFQNPDFEPLRYTLKDWMSANISAHSEDDECHSALVLATYMWGEVGDPTEEDMLILREYVDRYNQAQIEADDNRSYDWRKSASNFTEREPAYEIIRTLDVLDLANTFATLYELTRPYSEPEKMLTIQQGWAYIKFGISPSVLIDTIIESEGIEVILPAPIG